MTSPVRNVRLHATTTEDGRGLLELERDAKKAAKGIDDLSDSFDASAEHAKALDLQIEQTSAKIKDLGQQFATTGDTSLFKEIRGERSFLSQLEKIRKEIADEGDGIGVTLGSAIGSGAGRSLGGNLAGSIGDALSGARFRSQAIGALVALGVAASPALGAMIAGAVTGAVGVGGIAGGIFAASKNSQVRAAAKDFGESVSKDFFGSGASFVAPLVDALGILKQGFKDLDLRQTFEGLAPYVNDLANGLAGFGANFMAGVNQSLDRIGPALEILGQSLPRLGAAFGYMIKTMADGEGTLEGWLFLLGFLEANIKGIGNIIGWLSDQFHNMNQAVADFAGFMEDNPLLPPPVRAAFAQLNDDVEAFIEKNRIGQQVAGGYSTELLGLGTAADTAGQSFETLTVKTEAYYQFVTGQRDNQIAFERSMDDLAESVKENGRSLDITTEKGRANVTILGDLEAAARLTREENVKNGMNIETANALYDKQIARIAIQAEKLGFSKGKVDALLGSWRSLASMSNIELRAHFEASGTMLGEHSGLRRDEARGFASGGTTPAFEPFRVHDGETLWSNKEHFVATRSQTDALMSGAGMRAANGVRPVVVHGNAMAEAWFNAFVAEVQRRGGTLAVIGIREN